MARDKPKIGDILWGVWEHRYRNDAGLIEMEYVVYPVKVTHFFTGSYVDMHCVGMNTDGYTVVHWIPLNSVGKSVFTNPKDAAKLAAIMSDYFNQHWSFNGSPIRRTQWEGYLKEGGAV